jgi:hypothetical protein
MKMLKFIALAAVTGGAVVFSGCATTPDSRISAHPDVFAQLTPQQQALVRAGQVSIGMDMGAVKLALGDPDSVTFRTNANGQTQVWHYVSYGYYDGMYLYGGPYWGPYGRRRGGWGGWGGGWYPYAGGPVTIYDHFRIEFKDGKVVSISQEQPKS